MIGGEGGREGVGGGEEEEEERGGVDNSVYTTFKMYINLLTSRSMYRFVNYFLLKFLTA